MNNYNKKNWCEILIAVFIVLFIVFCGYKEITRDIPRERPTVSIEYNKNNVESTMGEHTWSLITLTGPKVGNSYLAGPSYDVGKRTASFTARPSEEVKVKFSSAPHKMKLYIWKDKNLNSTLEFFSQKIYNFNLPDEKGEYIFDVVGDWGELNNTSDIFRVIIK